MSNNIFSALESYPNKVGILVQSSGIQSLTDDPLKSRHFAFAGNIGAQEEEEEEEIEEEKRRRERMNWKKKKNKR